MVLNSCYNLEIVLVSHNFRDQFAVNDPMNVLRSNLILKGNEISKVDRYRLKLLLRKLHPREGNKIMKYTWPDGRVGGC